MPNTLKLIEQGAEFAGFGEDQKPIRTIVAMKDGWDVAKPEGFADVQALLKAVLDKAQAAEVTAAFARLGLADAQQAVTGLLAKVQAKLGDVPKWVQTLFEDVDSFKAGNTGALDWNPLKADETVTLDAERKIVLGVEGEAGLGAVAWSSWPDEKDKPLLRLDAHGKIGFSAGGAASLPGGALSVSIEAGAEAGLFYYYNAAGGGLYLVEVAKRLPDLPNPFRLEALWEAKDKHGFSGARFDFTGKASATVEVSLAYAGPLAGVPVDVSASLKVGAKFERGYTLSARPRDGGLYVSMSRRQLDAQELGGKITIGIGIPAIAAKVQAVLTRAVSGWDKELARIKPFLSPGTYLQDQLDGAIGKAAGELIKDEKLRAALESDLKGAFGIDTGDTSDLAEWLTDTLHGAIDSNASKLLGDAEVRVDAAVNSAWETLAGLIPSFGGEAGTLIDAEKAKVETQVKAALTGLIGQVKEPLEKLLKDLLGEVDAGGAAVGAAVGGALKKAGAQSDAAVTKLDDLFKGVREALEKYTEVLHKVAKTTEEALEKKISIAIHADNETSRELDVRIAGTFTVLDDTTKQAFRDFVAGDLENLALIATGKPEHQRAGFALDKANSREKLTLLRKGSSGVDFIGFGVSASFSTSVLARVELEIDGNGNIQLDSEGEVSARFSGDGQQREVSFADSVSLAVSRDIAAAAKVPPKVELGVSVIYRDEALETRELTDFTGSLGNAGLVSTGVAAQAQALLKGWNLPDKAPQADMSAKLWFEGDEIAALLRLGAGYREAPGAGDAGKLMPLTRKARREIFDIGWNAIRQYDLTPKREKALKSTKEEFWEKPEDLGDFLYAVDEGTIISVTQGLGQGTETLKAKLFDLLLMRNRLHGLVDVVDHASQAYASTPAGNDAPENGEWTPRDYFDNQDKILDGSRRWLATGGSLARIIFRMPLSDEVHPRTIALMAALNTLAGTPAKQVKLTLVDRRNKDKPVTMLVGPPPPPKPE
jgi:hypothetical protein